MHQGLWQGTGVELQSSRHHPLGTAQQQVGRGHCSPGCGLINNQPHLLHDVSLVLFLGAVLVLSVLTWATACRAQSRRPSASGASERRAGAGCRTGLQCAGGC